MPARRPLKPWTSMKQVWPLFKQAGEHIDPGFANFGVRVSPRGKCVWWSRYSEGTGKDRKQAETTLGLVQYEGATADGVRILDLYQAQEAAREWIAEQKDPAYAAQRKAEREAARAKPLTLKDGFEEFLLMRRTKRGDMLAATTKDSYRKTFDSHLEVASNWPLLTTDARQWSKLLLSISEKSPSRAMEAMSIVSGIYTHYETLEYPGLTRNPIRNVRRMRLFKPPPPREQHAPPVSLPKLVSNILGLRNTQSRDLLLVFLLGGLRKIAGMRLRKTIVDLSEGVIHVPPGERGWKAWSGDYPLNSQLLGYLKERASAEEGDWLFPARHGENDHREDIRGSLEKASEGLPFVLRPHDLRRTFATVCDILFPSDILLQGGLLAHKWALPDDTKTAVTVKYPQRSLEELRHGSDTIANAILEMAGVLPMTDATAEALKRRGINPEKLVLVEGDETDSDE